MPREVVVFDANVYRSIGRQTLSTIKRAELNMGIVAQAADSVAWELLARLGAADAKSSSAEAAIVALCEHTAIWDFGQIIPFSQSPLHQALIRQDERTLQNERGWHLGSLLLRIAGGDRCEAQVSAISEHARQQEHKYGSQLFVASSRARAVVADHEELSDPREITQSARALLLGLGDRFAAEILAMRILDAQRVENNEATLADMTDFVLGSAPVTARFVFGQALRSATLEIDPREPTHANSLWDAHLCALIHRTAHVRATATQYAAADVRVVTSDREILRSADEVGLRDCVFSLGEHCDRIGLGDLREVKRW
jgi:hypothetical protein